MASTTIQTAKAVLRKKCKNTLSLLSDVDKNLQSDILTKKLLSLPEFQASKRISVYLSTPEEVQTDQILKYMMANKKTCFIPHYCGPSMKMVPLQSLEDYESLPLTKWNIKQPRDDDIRSDALETGGLDLIIMPGLAFSMAGARLGRGKGYYDAYLKRCYEHGYKPVTVSLCFHQLLFDNIPVIPGSDMFVDKVLYPDAADLMENILR
ncbi:MTHFS [Acanthosepion pharaonis]|uniref:5-formyltetrahydrofolate cyclo-ligase n=1 Tax=Acanthosepion pharaonis TaxID=158019 RepID=A0A812DEZ0_ACAPH|nr:MTHFS [Sepia pharaonis]